MTRDMYLHSTTFLVYSFIHLYLQTIPWLVYYFDILPSYYSFLHKTSTWPLFYKRTTFMVYLFVRPFRSKPICNYIILFSPYAMLQCVSNKGVLYSNQVHTRLYNSNNLCNCGICVVNWFSIVSPEPELFVTTEENTMLVVTSILFTACNIALVYNRFGMLIYRYF